MWRKKNGNDGDDAAQGFNQLKKKLGTSDEQTGGGVGE